MQQDGWACGITSITRVHSRFKCKMAPLTNPSYNYNDMHASITLQLSSHNSGISNEVSYVAELQVAPEELNLVTYI